MVPGGLEESLLLLVSLLPDLLLDDGVEGRVLLSRKEKSVSGLCMQRLLILHSVTNADPHYWSIFGTRSASHDSLYDRDTNYAELTTKRGEAEL